MIVVVFPFWSVRPIVEFGLSIEKLERLENMANDLYDRVGRDSFRVYACLDAEAIREYKNKVTV